MSTNEEKEFSFMKEEIKRTPFYRRKWFHRLIWMIVLAVIFGGIAVLIMIFSFPWITASIEKTIKEETKVDVTEYLRENEAVEETVYDAQSAQEYLNHYQQIRAAITDVAQDAQEYLVEVRAVTDDTDWFEDRNLSGSISSGLIVQDDLLNVYILTENQQLEDADRIKVKFSNDTCYDGEILDKDKETGFYVVSVPIAEAVEKGEVSYRAGKLGSSDTVKLGDTVIAVGSPMGYAGSMEYGTITSKYTIQKVDSQFTVVTCNMLNYRHHSGVLLNSAGEVVGILSGEIVDEENSPCIAAYGVTSLKTMVKSMVEQQEIAALGVIGETVTDIVEREMDIPAGIYVKEVESGSAAMVAGIREGDILTAYNQVTLNNYFTLQQCLHNSAPGDSVKITLLRLVNEKYETVEAEVKLKQK